MNNKKLTGFALLGLVIGSAFWFAMHQFKTEEHIDPDTKEGRQRLVALSRNGQKLVDGIRKYKREHGSYPEKLDGLVPGDSAVTQMAAQFSYTSKDGPCGMTYRINETSNLKYVCEEQPNKRRTWIFNPGGTSPGSEIMIDKSDK